MKTVVAICLLIVALAEGVRNWPAAEAPPMAAVADVGPWVRTAQGWERLDTWRAPTAEPAAPTLHPAVVAGGMVLASLLALLATSRE